MKGTHGLPASACTYDESSLGASVVSAPCSQYHLYTLRRARFPLTDTVAHS